MEVCRVVISYLERANRLAQLVEHRTSVWEVVGSSPGWTNTQGLQVTDEKVLPFNYICEWLNLLVISDKDNKL